MQITSLCARRRFHSSDHSLTPTSTTPNRERTAQKTSKKGSTKEFAAQTQCNFAHRTRDADIIFLSFQSDAFFLCTCFLCSTAAATARWMHSIASFSYFTYTFVQSFEANNIPFVCNDSERRPSTRTSQPAKVAMHKWTRKTHLQQ